MGEGGQALHSTMVRHMIVLVKVVIMLIAGGQGRDHAGGPGGGQDGGHGGQGRDRAGGRGGGQDGGQGSGLSIGSQVKRKKNEPDKDAPSSLYILSATNPIRLVDFLQL